MIRIGKRNRQWIVKDGRRFGKGNAVFLEVVFRFAITPFKVYISSIA